nr:hypothetical protein [Mycetohabitans endofungorum]
MKPFHTALGATPRGATRFATMLVAATLALAATMVAAASAPQPDAVATPATAASQDVNEAVGLPNLKAINRPAGVAHSRVEFNTPRTPNFYEKSPNGTSITEYRDRGKPVEIQVHSNFGTRYQMSASPDVSPQVHESGKPSTRLPSLQLKY